MAPAHPSPEDREWLDEELRVVLARVGTERFTRGWILEPSDRFFPDRFVEGVSGVRTVARRLFAWAGLRLGVEVIDESPPEDDRRIRTWDIELYSVRPGYVSLSLSARGKPEQLPGALTSQLALAARMHLGLDVEPGDTPYRSTETANDPELEAELSGITSIVLGWGILALDAAERHHSAGEVVGNWHTYEVATETHGALSIAALAYLLAVQLVVRDTSEEERARLRALLRPNQAALLGGWCDELQSDRDALIERLGLRISDEPLPDFVVPPLFEDDEDEDDDADDEEADELLVRGWNYDRPVFRVHVEPSVRYGVLGALAGGAATVMLMATGLIGGAFFVPALGALAGVCAGIFVARRHATDACSDPACEAPLAEDAIRCPRCQGIVAGRIRSASQRLEAEEALGVQWYRERELPVPASLEEDERRA